MIRLWANGEEHILAPIVAGNISVVPGTLEAAREIAQGQRLSGLARGVPARVIRVSPRCRGLERRRLLDLGVLPGTLVMAEMDSPSGNCRAYRVRGALVALRREQGDMIELAPETQEAGEVKPNGKVSESNR